MNKKIFLTSAVIMCMAYPAIAETFPQDGNMLENKTYDNAATYANTGVYEGDVTADAEYSLNPYSVAAGSYFTGIDNSTNQATTAQCTSGNFCPGVTSTTFDNNAFGDTGLRACPANYSGSATGATANTDCYRACSTTDVAKSATVSGQMYYDGTSGDGVNACVPESCVAGWHKKDAVPDIKTTIGNTEGEHVGSVNNTGTFVEYSYKNGGVTGETKGASYYGLSSNKHNRWAVDYGSKGFLYGQARCSKTQGYNDTVNNNNDNINNPTTLATLSDETGQIGGLHCYCQVDGYKPADGTIQNIVSSWVYVFSSSDAASCASYCAQTCWDRLQHTRGSNPEMRAAILGTILFGPASCEANTINITWNDASAEDIAATGAATTVYEGDIKTPLKAVTKPGKTFVGWKFIKPTTPVQQ